MKVAKLGEPNYDDPSLALLFSQLKSKTLQTAKGTSEIKSRTEFNFVLQTARVFIRMGENSVIARTSLYAEHVCVPGCHALALHLVMSWSFERPTSPFVRNTTTTNIETDAVPELPGPTAIRRPSSGIPDLNRRKSMIVDMDVPSDPSTRAATPDTTNSPVNNNGVGKASEFKSLLKTAKQDVTVPEFNMDSFF